MRRQLNKLVKGKSTKAERRFSELLKKNHIRFKYRQMIQGREVDFLVGKYAIEIDGHDQEGKKNHILADVGYIPIHYNNSDITENLNIKYLKNGY